VEELSPTANRRSLERKFERDWELSPIEVSSSPQTTDSDGRGGSAPDLYGRATETLEMERLEAEKIEAEHLNAERLEAGRLEVERLGNERTEVERLEKERREMERLEMERAETERGSETGEDDAVAEEGTGQAAPRTESRNTKLKKEGGGARSKKVAGPQPGATRRSTRLRKKVGDGGGYDGLSSDGGAGDSPEKLPRKRVAPGEGAAAGPPADRGSTDAQAEVGDGPKEPAAKRTALRADAAAPLPADAGSTKAPAEVLHVSSSGSSLEYSLGSSPEGSFFAGPASAPAPDTARRVAPDGTAGKSIRKRRQVAGTCTLYRSFRPPKLKGRRR